MNAERCSKPDTPWQPQPDRLQPVAEGALPVPHRPVVMGPAAITVSYAVKRPSLGFSNRAIAELMAIWNDPARPPRPLVTADIDPFRLKSAMGKIFIAEFQPDGEARFLRFGRQIAAAVGQPLAGYTLTEAIDSDLAPELLALYRQVVAEQRPMMVEHDMHWDGGGVTIAEIGLFPYRNPDLGTEGVVGLFDVRAEGSPRSG